MVLTFGGVYFLWRPIGFVNATATVNDWFGLNKIVETLHEKAESFRFGTVNSQLVVDNACLYWPSSA